MKDRLRKRIEVMQRIVDRPSDDLAKTLEDAAEIIRAASPGALVVSHYGEPKRNVEQRDIVHYLETMAATARGDEPAPDR